jgi:phosphatidate cytidylyltransferase
MTQPLPQHLFASAAAFDHPVTIVTVIGIAAALLLSAAGMALCRFRGWITAEQWKEFRPRWTSWVVLVLAILVPLLLGAVWTIAAVCLLSLLVYREYARATGLFREKTISAVVVIGILVLAFACLDNWARLFFATGVLTVGLITIVTIPQDRPKGHTQRTALGVMGFLLFGYSFGYLGLMAQPPSFSRPLLLMVLVGVEMNDVFAYCSGRLVGGPKLLPNTSPNKTIAGSIGALLLTTPLVAAMAHWTFLGTDVDRASVLVILGAGTSILGQFGDLLLSSIKRDLGLKDIGIALPGHGGLLDRFASLVLVPPATYHFLSLYLGPLNAIHQSERLLTGG